MKKCTKCGTEYEATRENFYANKRHKGGLASSCKNCKYVLSRKYEKTRKGRASRKMTKRKHLLRTLYNMSLVEYQQMFDAQGGACAICYSTQSSKLLAVDHCHETGKIRGLLCSKCNMMLGQVNDDSATLRSAANYLDKFNR